MCIFLLSDARTVPLTHENSSFREDRKEGQSVFALTVLQVPLIQNTQYATLAYFRVAYNIPP